MTRERATQEAKKFLFDTDLLKPETRALILRDLLISACELEAAAMAEKCAKVIDKTFGLPNNLGDNIRSISPLGVLEAHDQAVRLEALKWSINPHKVNYYQRRVILEIERLAALRATPQPTAVKEPTNG